ncbi:70 kDa peptidyl-prolyl isomerase isoform X3 [Oryza sativa Japonica Group]|uniref:70 kDa peptidyl-prolyl isomerase isoform X3 n=1 Tax=Oryza sativa subsp. japonica TaxID=39947 RepID=UPI0007754219|nr:70 kDa peptidyl-prolyl isomerase isoform X3 [Oryza sativa Japonica Group]
MPIPVDLGEPDNRRFFVWVEDNILTILPPDADDHEYSGFNMWTVQKPSAGSTAINLLFPGGATAAELMYAVPGASKCSKPEDDDAVYCVEAQENVMHGLSLVVSAMRPGERAIFTIPPKLAITKSGSPASIPSSIPPEQTLRFEIELISLFAITDILENGSILKKIIKRPLPDKSPSNHADTVIVNYNACLEDGNSVSKSERLELNLASRTGFFCPALKYAVKTMREGEEAIFIVKPRYAFGAQGRDSTGDQAAVPPDATLYLYVQLAERKTAKQNEAEEKGPFIDGPNEAKTTARALPKRRPVKPGFSLPVVQNDRPTYPGHVLFVPHVVEEEEADAGQAASTTTSGLATPPTTAADVGTSAATNSSAAQGSGIVKTETGFLFKRFRPWPAN